MAENATGNSSWYTFFTPDFSFDIEDTCSSFGIDIKEECTIRFSNGKVFSYGDTTFGNFKAQPDIAGYGAWGALFPTFVICALALIFIYREYRWYKMARFEAWKEMMEQWQQSQHSRDFHQKKPPRQPSPPKINPSFIKRHFKQDGNREEDVATRYRIARALIIAIADAQSIVALSYGINFGIQSKCTLSAYHYNVGVNIILSACATITFSVVMLRDYWRGKFAPALRFIISGIIFGVLGRFLSYQRGQEYPPETVGWYPDTKSAAENPDSTIFLPMACFLDPRLDPWSGLTQQQKDRVSLSKAKSISPEVVFYGLLTACFIIGHVAHIRKRKARYHPEIQQRWRRISKLTVWYYAVSLLICIVVHTACVIHIANIRTFVWKSGWIEGGDGDYNEEKNVNGIGQLAPIITTIWFFFQLP